MSANILPAGLLLALLLLPAGLARAAEPPKEVKETKPSLPQQVDQALHRGVAYIYGLQNPDGTWELVPKPVREKQGYGVLSDRQWGGATALAVYTLLVSGERPQAPKLVKAIEFLKKADLVGNYALAMRCQIWPRLPQSREITALAQQDARTLEKAMLQQGDAKGFYYYDRGPTETDDYPWHDPAWYDHSVSQVAVLGVWSCAQVRGVEIPTAYWQTVDAAWKKQQLNDGGWNYTPLVKIAEHGPSSPSMTAAGVATLFITQDQLQTGVAGCAGNQKNEAIDRGMKWMTDHLADVKEFRQRFYALYGVERCGVAGGYKYFGTVDWFQFGAKLLIGAQEKDGSWNRGIDKGTNKMVFLPDTCFGVIFLSRGRAPVVMNKLQYSIDRAGDKPVDARWNQRPRDAANIVGWIGKSIEVDLNWQIVNLDVPADDLHDAPILYIAGDQALAFKPAEIDKLRNFVEQGGLILANADCGSPQFTASYKKLAATLFPDYEFRELPADHVIYTRQMFPAAKAANPPSVLGLSNGTRELMLLFPKDDAARYWHTRASAARPAFHEFAANLYNYAVDKKSMRNKGETYIVHADPAVKATRTLKVARLQYAGNWNPEPGGWRRIANLMHNDRAIDLDVQTIKLSEGKLDKSFAVAHLTGTSPLQLDAPAKAELAKYLGDGGTLLIDAAGGATKFAEKTDELVTGLIPDSKPPAVLPPDHPVYAAPGKPEQITYRAFSKKVLGNLDQPRLKGIDRAGRTAIFVSSEDLSTGLVGQSIDGIVGYEPSAASWLVEAVLQYAAAK